MNFGIDQYADKNSWLWRKNSEPQMKKLDKKEIQIVESK